MDEFQVAIAPTFASGFTLTASSSSSSAAISLLRSFAVSLSLSLAPSLGLYIEDHHEGSFCKHSTAIDSWKTNWP